MIQGFPDRLSQPAVALAFGVTRQGVSHWDCPRAKDGKYNLPDVIAWKEEKIREELAADGARTSSKGEVVAVQRKREAEAALKEAQAGEMVGMLVRTEDVDRQWERCLLVFRQQLEGLGATMAKRLEHLAAEDVAEKLNSRVADLLAELVDAYENETTEDE